MSNNHMIQQEPDVQAEPTVKEKHILLSFIKERPILTILFGLSLLLLLVDSGLIFYIPNCFWMRVADLIDVFAGAYVTGILMLLLVEEFPRERRRQAAMRAVFPLVKSLYYSINRLTEMIRCSAGNGDIDNLYFTNRIVYVHVFQNGGISRKDYYRLIDESRKEASSITRLISDFSLTPVSMDCDKELLEMISDIRADRIIANTLPNISISGAVLGLSETNNMLLRALKVMEALYPDLSREAYSLMTQADIAEYKEYLKATEPVTEMAIITAHADAVRRDT